jgi:uracil-DNA glycosylase
MKINETLQCSNYCIDVDLKKYFQKNNINSDTIKMVMISEALPNDFRDYFDQPGIPQFIQTTNQAFLDAGYTYKTMDDYKNDGIYLTTAIKCKKKDYLVSAETIRNCSILLSREIEQFKNVKVIMLMGDFAIKSINYIWKTKYGTKIIPSGSTYKIRSGKYEYNEIRFFPSYTQTGESFSIEKVKRKMIAEDIKNAMEIII